MIEIFLLNYDIVWNYGSFLLDKGFSIEDNFVGLEFKEFINVIFLDKYLEINWLVGIELLKIDVEGFELNVLNGVKNIIDRYKFIIFVEVYIYYFNELIFYLDKIGYKCYWFIFECY